MCDLTGDDVWLGKATQVHKSLMPKKGNASLCRKASTFCYTHGHTRPKLALFQVIRVCRTVHSVLVRLLLGLVGDKAMKFVSLS